MITLHIVSVIVVPSELEYLDQGAAQYLAPKTREKAGRESVMRAGLFTQGELCDRKE